MLRTHTHTHTSTKWVFIKICIYIGVGSIDGIRERSLPRGTEFFIRIANILKIALNAWNAKNVHPEVCRVSERHNETNLFHAKCAGQRLNRRDKICKSCTDIRSVDPSSNRRTIAES